MVEEIKEEKYDKQSKKKLKQLLKMDLKDLALKKKKSKKKKVKHLNKDVMVIDIDDKFMNIVVGKYYKDDITVKKSIQYETPENCYEDGRIVSEEFLYEEIKDIIKREKIKAKYISFTSNSSLIINREIVIPKVEDDELETVIRYEVEQYLPINLNDYIIQYLIIEELQVENIEKIKVQVICYPEKIAYQYYNLIKRLKLNPLSLDITFNSLLKVINYSQEINNKDYVIQNINVFVDIGFNYTEINIFNDGNLSFTRMMKIGYNDVMKDSDNNFEIEYYISEIDRVLQFYRNKNYGKNIEKIYLLGEGSKIESIIVNMSQKINSTIVPIDKIGYVDLNDKDMYKFIKSIGALIRL